MEEMEIEIKIEKMIEVESHSNIPWNEEETAD